MEFECNYCRISFERKFNLERHLKTKKHTTNEVRGGKIEDFLCKDCDIVFQKDFLLKRHFLSIKHKLKINPELFKCTQKHKNKECNKLFKSNRELQNHIADNEDYYETTERILYYFFNNYDFTQLQLQSITDEDFFNDKRKNALSYFHILFRNTICKKGLGFIKGDNGDASSFVRVKSSSNCKISTPITIEFVVNLINRLRERLNQRYNFYEDYLRRKVFKGDFVLLDRELQDLNEMSSETKREVLRKFKTALLYCS